eukprot:s10656_g1.t1
MGFPLADIAGSVFRKWSGFKGHILSACPVLHARTVAPAATTTEDAALADTVPGSAEQSAAGPAPNTVLSASASLSPKPPQDETPNEIPENPSPMQTSTLEQGPDSTTATVLAPPEPPPPEPPALPLSRQVEVLQTCQTGWVDFAESHGEQLKYYCVPLSRQVEVLQTCQTGWVDFAESHGEQLKYYCVICGQWCAPAAGGLKSHMRRSHPTQWTMDKDIMNELKLHHRLKYRGDVRNLLALVTRLSLRQEDDLAATRADNAFLFYLETITTGIYRPIPSFAGNFYAIAQQWQKIRDETPERVSLSLRTTLLLAYMTEFHERLRHAVEPDNKEASLKEGWLQEAGTSPPCWTYSKWDPDRKEAIIDTSRTPITHAQVLDTAREAPEQLQLGPQVQGHAPAGGDLRLQHPHLLDDGGHQGTGSRPAVCHDAPPHRLQRDPPDVHPHRQGAPAPPAIGADTRQLCKVSILQRSGETNLTLDIGRLRFIDTMNFCKASGLERAFPLTSSRHPVLKHARDSADGTDAVWEALLRKLPMPWSYFADCDAFNKPAVWPLECYHSELSGKCSDADH